MRPTREQLLKVFTYVCYGVCAVAFSPLLFVVLVSSLPWFFVELTKRLAAQKCVLDVFHATPTLAVVLILTPCMYGPLLVTGNFVFEQFIVGEHFIGWWKSITQTCVMVVGCGCTIVTVNRIGDAHDKFRFKEKTANDREDTTCLSRG